MTRNKFLYILSMICLALTFIGGACALIGFFSENPTLQIVGVIGLVVFYLLSLLFDAISKIKPKK